MRPKTVNSVKDAFDFLRSVPEEKGEVNLGLYSDSINLLAERISKLEEENKASGDVKFV